jgi:hypothetical protein
MDVVDDQEREMTISNAIRRDLVAVVGVALLVLGIPGRTAGAFQDQNAAQAQSNSAPDNSGSQGGDNSASQGSAQGSSDASDSSASSAPVAAPLSADQLDALVAPIALYPDNLVAQILAASTFPDQVAIADYWVSQNKNLTGSALGDAVNNQTWDPSVKALAQFPDVLDNMAKNLAWTSSLGQAFHDQQSDVMQAVQVMRQKAQAAGNLQSTPQIQVTQPAPQTIVIQPANPQVVYVPVYNPTVVYGTPYVVPYWTPPPVAYVGAGISFGIGIGIGVGWGGGCWGCGHPWGWGGWGMNWGGGWGGGGNTTIIYNHNTYISNRSWHGGYYNNYHSWTNRNVPNGGRNGNHGLIGGNGGVEHGPNGGRNGDHGLIGGNGGVEHTGDRNQPNGGRNGDHGLIGGNGGVQHQPDGGRNGDHGLIGGNGGVQRDQHQTGFDNDHRDANRNRWGGDGNNNRAESNRGRTSMRQPVQHREPQQHFRAPQQHFSAPRGGGGGRRR